MARRKNPPESVRMKCSLAERLRTIRMELFGDRGGPELARQLGIPVRTWYNYESGVTVPAEVMLRFVELTAVEPLWLLHGRGPKFRILPPPNESATATVEALLRTALQQLEQAEARGLINGALHRNGAANDGDAGDPATGDVVLIGVENAAQGPERLTESAGPRYVAARREWQAAVRDCRCIRVDDDAMAPIVSAGAFVAFSDAEDDPTTLEGKLVVAWMERRPVVRWFQLSGPYALLRAENPAHEPSTLLVDLRKRSEVILRRILWISTPH